MKSPRWFAFANGVYWLLLALWTGSLVMSAVTAGIMFPLLKNHVVVALPEYAAYTGSHGTLLAGRVMSQLFAVQDIIELFALFGVALITIGHFVAFRLSPRSPANVLRIVAGCALCVVVAYKSFMVMPRMYINLDEFWTTARAGEVEKAEAAKAAFDADHPTAMNLMVGTFAGLVVFIFASAAALSSPALEERKVSGGGERQLEEPELLRKLNL